MPPKLKGKESKNVIPETVEQINLDKYCPKEIFDILLVCEADEYSRSVLNNIIETGRHYEDISCLTFITYDEVIGLVDRYEKVILPPTVKPTLEDVCHKAKQIMQVSRNLPSEILVQLMKLKLTEVMYQHYIKEVTKMQKRKKLEEDLNILTKECKKGDDKDKGKGKGSKSSKDSKSGASSKGNKGSAKAEEVKVIEDYTAIPIEAEHDIIFDDDIFNHVWFYAFQGFYDPELLHEFSHNNIPLTAVIKVIATVDDSTTMSSESLESLYEEYWHRLYQYFDGPKRLAELENTILMTFTSFGDTFQELFQQLLFIIKNISDIKLQHVNYLRHIQIYETRDVYNYIPLECLSLYNKMMEKIPFELSNESVLFNSLLNEVCARVDITKSTTSMSENPSRFSLRSINRSSTNSCVDPCKIDAFFKSRRENHPKKILLKRPPQSFIVHECDEINIILNSYKKYGRFVYESMLNLLKIQRPLHALDQYLTDCSHVIHKHDIDPSTKTVPKDEEIFMHIFYLISFSNFDCTEKMIDFEDTDLTQNLQTYHKIDFVQSAQTTVQYIIRNDSYIGDETKYEEIGMYEDFGIQEGVEQTSVTTLENVFLNKIESEEEEQISVYPESRDKAETQRSFRNYYNESAIQYFWKEKLLPDVLLQEIYKAHNNYLYMEQRFSPGTDDLLLQFSDCLDEFGVHTKIYEQSLVTPVCLRDFCRYVTVEKAKWLEQNKPPKYFRKCEELEICKGVNRINQLRLFQEYSHLLETTIKTEEQSEEKPIIHESGVTFEQLLQELKNYPSNLGITNECNKIQYEKNFLAYDLGTKYFQIKGGKTVFYSHDDVKVSVDNTRFLDEDPKCTINLGSKGNNLIVHYNKFYFTEDFTYHMHLADGIIITYIVRQPITPKLIRKSFGIDIDELNSHELTGAILLDREKQEETKVIPEVSEEVKVLSVDQNYFKSLMQKNSVTKKESKTNEFEFKDTAGILDSLKQAVAAKRPIYKVNKNLTHLKRLKPAVEIPLSSILNRILHKTIQKREFLSLTKRYISQKKKQPKFKCFFDCRIAWPNGLYISFYPSEVKSSYVEVKQEFLIKPIENSLIEHEEFRLFTREGYILIKYIDGSIKILKSNGDTIYYEKLDADDEIVQKWRLRPCHLKNINDYRKKLNRLLRNKYMPTNTAAISRRGQFHSKKGYVLNPDLVNILENSKVPYLKSTLLKFDGDRICLENGKVTQKRIFHITDEQDFFAQEIYYERSDGFKSYFDKHGKQQVKFADGTKISSTIHVAKQLADGYVYISLNFQYEHPNYATVLYSFDNSLDIVLNNATLRRDIKDTISVKVDEDILTTAKRDNVLFQKTCLKCSSKYKCSINIHPFINKMYSSETFLHAQDSYNKQFRCDYAGNCQRNFDYIKGPFNALNCNHYKYMSYKKMFVVNRDYSGCMFWTDNMVTSKRKSVESDKNVVITDSVDVNNAKVKVIKIRRKVFEEYCNRFLNINLLKEQLCLAKYKQEEVKQLHYTTSRVINKMVNFTVINKCLTEIMQFFIKFKANSDLARVLTKLSKEEDIDPEENMSTKIIITEVKEPPVCKCKKTVVNMAGKIERWQKECEKYRQLIRNNVIIPYFSSEFCQILDSNSESTVTDVLE